MVHPSEAIQLVTKVLTNSSSENHNQYHIDSLRLKSALNVALKPIFGLFNGYYMLDLSIEMHRICLGLNYY
jgi:hypothetical protein